MPKRIKISLPTGKNTGSLVRQLTSESNKIYDTAFHGMVNKGKSEMQIHRVLNSVSKQPELKVFTVTRLAMSIQYLDNEDYEPKCKYTVKQKKLIHDTITELIVHLRKIVNNLDPNSSEINEEMNAILFSFSKIHQSMLVLPAEHKQQLIELYDYFVHFMVGNKLRNTSGHIHGIERFVFFNTATPSELRDYMWKHRKKDIAGTGRPWSTSGVHESDWDHIPGYIKVELKLSKYLNDASDGLQNWVEKNPTQWRETLREYLKDKQECPIDLPTEWLEEIAILMVSEGEVEQ